ncbi:MAG: glutathione-independent formaldehyde dehydrogenase [Pseudonocardiales bacterium]|jgi:threonine dehydrogenase-like Zn-dependent dehydrogenase|nr:glutathione-independent formaldehyde dehydrogenase [Pseudonocardiales bacterium]
MRALVYHGPRSVSIDTVPDPTIEKPTDVLVKITATNICGSDLHMYEGRTDVEEGKILGHENMGEVIEVGAAVDRVKVGDVVSLPFNVACGFCKNCERGFTGFCLTVNPGFAGGAYGYADMGPYQGGQAEFLRVPYGDFNCLRLPPDVREKQRDYTMLSDIFPTGYHATELADVRSGDSVVIWGAGPVGLMAALSANLRGASKVMVVDRHPDRLALVDKFDAIPINDTKGDPVEQVMELTGGEGADKGCECVGYQAHDPQGHEHPNMAINGLISAVRATGAIGTVGVYVPEDPQSEDELATEGRLAVDFGRFFQKGLRMGTGQANVKAYNRQLRDLIAADRVKPGSIVSHELPLDEAPGAYEHFDAREKGWTKVVLHP